MQLRVWLHNSISTLACKDTLGSCQELTRRPRRQLAAVTTRCIASPSVRALLATPRRQGPRTCAAEPKHIARMRKLPCSAYSIMQSLAQAMQTLRCSSRLPRYQLQQALRSAATLCTPSSGSCPRRTSALTTACRRRTCAHQHNQGVMSTAASEPSNARSTSPRHLVCLPVARRFTAQRGQCKYSKGTDNRSGHVIS